MLGASVTFSKVLCQVYRWRWFIRSFISINWWVTIFLEFFFIAIWIIIISIISIITTLNPKLKCICVCRSSPNSYQFIKELINNLSTSDLVPYVTAFAKLWRMSFTFSIILFLPLIMSSFSFFQIIFMFLLWSILFVFSLKSDTLTGPNIFTSTSL